MKTYTDDEIVRALECCVECDTFGGECIEDCPFKEVDDCTFVLRRETLDLIKRQQAEIERLQRHNKEYGFCNLLGNCLVYSKNLKDYNDMRKGLKSEAIKEFAERLTNRISDSIERSIDSPDGNNYFITDVYTNIDNLVKEMTEDKV